jgi:hypothetical protein
MSAYTCKKSFIEVRFMCGIGMGFNIARALKDFVNAARMQYVELSILPLHGSGNNMCKAMDVPGIREGIERLYWHEVKITMLMKKCGSEHSWHYDQ